jgi:hypothetical protein
VFDEDTMDGPILVERSDARDQSGRAFCGVDDLFPEA